MLDRFSSLQRMYECILAFSQRQLTLSTSPLAYPCSHLRRRWNAISLEIIAILTEQLLLYPSYNLVTTGHSLGGALSILGAISLKRHFPDEFSEGVKCYSYGAPRVGVSVFMFNVYLSPALTHVAIE